MKSFLFSLLLLSGVTWAQKAPQEKTALVVQNYEFDSLGNLEPVLQTYGFAITTLHLPQDQDKLAKQDPLAPDLVVILGGPMGAYETEKHPFLEDEIRILQVRLQQKRPSFGICLGAQLMARALGARVYQGSIKELGWYPLVATPEGLRSPLAPLLQADSQIYQSHSDHYDAPPGATILGKTSAYAYQAFSVGTHAMATQFHPEVTPRMMTQWEWFIKLPNTPNGNEKILEVMKQTATLWPRMQPRIQRFYEAWLQQTGLIHAN